MSYKKHTSLFLIICLLTAQFPVFSLSPEKKNKVAVFELKPVKASHVMTRRLSFFLTEVIAKFELFTVMGHEEIAEALEALPPLRKINPNNDQDEKLAKLAGALGVDLLVAGSFSQVGKLRIIALRLFDSAKGKTINTAYTSCVCSESELKGKIYLAARELFHLDSGIKKPVKKPARQATRKHSNETAVANKDKLFFYPHVYQETVETAITKQKSLPKTEKPVAKTKPPASAHQIIRRKTGAPIMSWAEKKKAVKKYRLQRPRQPVTGKKRGTVIKLSTWAMWLGGSIVTVVVLAVSLNRNSNSSASEGNGGSSDAASTGTGGVRFSW